MNTKAPRGTLPLTLWLLAGWPVGGIAQPPPLPSRLEPYSWTSGALRGERGPGAEASPAVRHRVSAPGAAWLRVRFEPAFLGAESFVLLTSQQDGATQRLDGAALRQWRNTSAYFNGDAVDVALYVAPNDAGVRVGIDRLVVGEWAGGEALDGDSLCGPTDDRVPSWHPAVGRLPNAGCTAWIATTGTQVTAGHCVGHGADVVEFDVPPSLPDGTIQHPGPEDQYAVDPASFQSGAGGTDDDWGTFAVFDNPVTGLQPVEAQGGGLGVAQSAGSAWTRITGCGVDGNDPQRNRTQQTHLGPGAGLSGNVISYQADTTTGNSGSPVIDEAAGVAIGVHNTSACTPDGGANSGTSTFNAAFWSAVTGAGSPQAWRINAGGPRYTDTQGRRFGADRAYAPGRLGYSGGQPRRFHEPIANTSDDRLYQDVRLVRTGSFFYRFDAAGSGRYDVTLHLMAPTIGGAGGVVMDVVAEGEPIFEDLDVGAEAGGAYRALVKTFVVEVSDGRLDLQFTSVNKAAVVSAITVLEAPASYRPDR